MYVCVGACAYASGPDCSVSLPANVSYWTHEVFSGHSLARASHKAAVHGDVMWVIGGHVFNYTKYQMVIAWVSMYRKTTRFHPTVYAMIIYTSVSAASFFFSRLLDSISPLRVGCLWIDQPTLLLHAMVILWLCTRCVCELIPARCTVQPVSAGKNTSTYGVFMCPVCVCV